MKQQCVSQIRLFQRQGQEKASGLRNPRGWGPSRSGLVRNWANTTVTEQTPSPLYRSGGPQRPRSLDHTANHTATISMATAGNGTLAELKGRQNAKHQGTVRICPELSDPVRWAPLVPTHCLPLVIEIPSLNRLTVEWQTVIACLIMVCLFGLAFSAFLPLQKQVPEPPNEKATRLVSTCIHVVVALYGVQDLEGGRRNRPLCQ